MAQICASILVLSIVVPHATAQAVMVTADPVVLHSTATLTCTVDPSMLGEGISVSSLQYEWTIGGAVMQSRSALKTFFISTVGVNDARADYGCDVFKADQEESLFERGFGRLQVNIPSFSMTFVQTTRVRSPINYVGQNATYSCRSAVIFSLTDLVPSVQIFSPTGALIEGEHGRVTTSALVKSRHAFERTLTFTPLSAADNGMYRCTGSISLRMANPLVTIGQGSPANGQIRVFEPSLRVTLLSSLPAYLLNLPPFNSLSLTCIGEVYVRSTHVPLDMEIIWSGKPIPVAPEASTTSMSVGTRISNLPVHASQPGNNTYYCQAILDVSPAADLLNQTQSVTVEFIGPSPPLPPTLAVPNSTLFNNARIQWRVTKLSYGPEEYKVLYGLTKTELIQESDTVSSGADISRNNFDLSVNLIGLSQFTTYYYLVQASNFVASSRSSVQDFTTTSLFPSPPRNLVAEPYSDTMSTYIFSWDPPIEANGEIQEYLLICETLVVEDSISSRFDAGTTRSMLELIYGVRYNCTVRARNEANISQPSNTVSLPILNTDQTSESSRIAGAVIGVALTFGVVILVVVMSILIIRRRRIKDMEKSSTTGSDETKSTNDEDFLTFLTVRMSVTSV